MSIALPSFQGFLKPAGVGGGGDFDETGLLWRLRASDLSLSNGDPVASWTDVSGNGHHWTQGTSGNRPTFATAQINGHAAVQFAAASSQYVIGPDLTALSLTEIDTYLIVKINNDPPGAGSSTGLWRLCSTATSDSATHYPWTDGVIYQSAFIDMVVSPRVSVNPTPSLAAWRLLRLTAKAGTNLYTMDLDGANIAQATKAAGDLDFPTITWLGASRNDSTSFYLDGFVAEYFAFSTKRDATQNTEIRDYLNDYYALSIA